MMINSKSAKTKTMIVGNALATALTTAIMTALEIAIVTVHVAIAIVTALTMMIGISNVMRTAMICTVLIWDTECISVKNAVTTQMIAEDAESEEEETMKNMIYPGHGAILTRLTIRILNMKASLLKN